MIPFLGQAHVELWTKAEGGGGVLPPFNHPPISHAEFAFYCICHDKLITGAHRRHAEWLVNKELKSIPDNLYLKIENGGKTTEPLKTHHLVRWQAEWAKQKTLHPEQRDSDWVRCAKYLYSLPENVVGAIWDHASELLMHEPDIDDLVTRAQAALFCANRPATSLAVRSSQRTRTSPDPRAAEAAGKSSSSSKRRRRRSRIRNPMAIARVRTRKARAKERAKAKEKARDQRRRRNGLRPIRLGTSPTNLATAPGMTTPRSAPSSQASRRHAATSSARTQTASRSRMPSWT
eukprot:SAG11_NODE_5683_length_1487_cov_9.733429_1_plen_290_part_00